MLNKQGITISLCMIVRDEEETIARCLETVEKIVDEIIVVDTGSVDRTKEIVEKYTSNIYDFQWIDDFAAARNFSFSKARSIVSSRLCVSRVFSSATRQQPRFSK